MAVTRLAKQALRARSDGSSAGRRRLSRGKVQDMSAGYLAEVSTELAKGEIARIYAEIRRLSAGPLVALLYRHLASQPGALAALWRSVGPILDSGELQERAWAAARTAWTGPVPDTGDALRDLAGDSLTRAVDVIEVYNRANPVNYMIICMLRVAGFAVTPATRAALAPAWSPPAAISVIPPIPSMDALPAEVRAMVDSFAKADAPGAPLLVPTLYRHVSHWPLLLALVAREVQPRLLQGVFTPAIKAFEADCMDAAARLAARHAFVADPLLATPALQNVFERFGQVIPEMVVIGSFLRRMLLKT